MTGTALLLVNPNSRQGRESLPKVRDLLRQAGVEFIELPQDSGETPSDAIIKRAAQVDRIIVGGGDGSLNAAAKGLLATGLPLGVLPLGTANDFARTVGLPFDLPAAVKIIAGGKTAQVDLGDANGHPFLNVASVGFSADLAASLTQQAKKRWGKLGYGLLRHDCLPDHTFLPLFSNMVDKPKAFEHFKSRSEMGAFTAAV
ncbi:hypothetical protein GCM10011491_38080 [Brucella endophytica]|uniref:DAGKc domain-containing protein n=1 Tax=Brucella endophytica TaxID=1963359 RepID=A0A916SNM7_9HYPH|nr:diacylglycerol kinase family protein [Brucella endophytica]GGB06349.1 hypothetical protein GCM10011491_38080 [Brucella endophytica]